MSTVSSAPCVRVERELAAVRAREEEYWIPDDDQEAGREHLAAELGERVELEQVVEHPDRADQRAGDQHDAGVVEHERAAAATRNGSCWATRYAATRPPSIASAAEVRDRHRVHVAVADLGDRAGAQRDLAGDDGQQVGRPPRRRGRRGGTRASASLSPRPSAWRRAARATALSSSRARRPRRSTRPCVAGDVDDRGGLAARRLARVDDHVDLARRASPRPASASVAAGMPGEVGRADGQRAGALEQRRGRRRGRASAPRRCRGCRRGPTAARAAGGRPGSAGRARTPRPAPGRSRARRWRARRASSAALTSTGGGMSRPRPLASSRPRTAVGVERVGADAVDGVGGQHDQLAPLDGEARRLDRGLALLVGRRSENVVASRRSASHGGHRASRAVSEARRDRPGRVVADVGPAAGRREDGRRGLALDVGVLDADHSAGPQQQRGRGAPSDPDRVQPVVARRRARACGSWSRASGATDSQASSGMYGGLQVTTSTVPARSSNASAMSPCRRSTPVPARLRAAQACAGSSSSTACTGRRAPRRRSPWRPRPSRCRGRPRPARSTRPAPLDRPAGEQLGLRARHEDARADRELDVAEGRRAGQVLQRLAGGAPGDQGVVRLERRRRRPRRPARSRRGWCRARGRAARRRRAPGWRHPASAQPARVAPTSAGRRHGDDHCSSAASRAARSASTQESSTGWRSPSSTWSRL